MEAHSPSLCCCLLQVSTLTNLRQLALCGPEYEADGYKPLTGLVSLECLEISVEGTYAVSDTLSELTGLKALTIKADSALDEEEDQQAPVQALPHLTQLTHLVSLRVGATGCLTNGD